MHQRHIFTMTVRYKTRSIFHSLKLNRRMRKPTICICKNKGTDQLCNNYTADQHFCFHCRDSTISLLLYIIILKLLAPFCDCTCWFVLDMVRTPHCFFSCKDSFYLVWHLDLVMTKRCFLYKCTVVLPNRVTTSSVADSLGPVVQN